MPHADVTQFLDQLRLVLSHLPESIPLSPGNGWYNFLRYEPDLEKIKLYGTTEAALNNSLEITFVPNGRRSDDTPCKFEFAEHGPGLVAVVNALTSELSIVPNSAILKKWVDDLLLKRPNSLKSWHCARARGDLCQ